MRNNKNDVIVQKAGCILINKKDKTIALVYREKYNDYSFPKGHLEEGETLKECALRETAEETKRECKFLKEEPIYIEEYVTKGGENVLLTYFLSEDVCQSSNNSLDTHETIWVPFEDVYSTLTYSTLKVMWNSIKDEIETYFK